MTREKLAVAAALLIATALMVATVALTFRSALPDCHRDQYGMPDCRLLHQPSD